MNLSCVVRVSKEHASSIMRKRNDWGEDIARLLQADSFRPHYGPGVDSASNRNEYQECSLVVKAAGA